MAPARTPLVEIMELIQTPIADGLRGSYGAKGGKGRNGRGEKEVETAIPLFLTTPLDVSMYVCENLQPPKSHNNATQNI